MTTEEKIASGLNDSNVHEDFMIGSSDLTIYGILQDGTKELVFENGNWPSNAVRTLLFKIKKV